MVIFSTFDPLSIIYIQVQTDNTCLVKLLVRFLHTNIKQFFLKKLMGKLIIIIIIFVV